MRCSIWRSRRLLVHKVQVPWTVNVFHFSTPCTNWIRDFVPFNSHFFFLGAFFRQEASSPPKVAKLVFEIPFQVLQDGLELHSGMWYLLSKLGETSTRLNLLLHLIPKSDGLYYPGVTSESLYCFSCDYCLKSRTVLNFVNILMIYHMRTRRGTTVLHLMWGL